MLLDKDIDTIISRAFENEVVTIVDCKLYSHSNEKVGFLGDHRNLELTIKRKGESVSETHKFFVKALPQASDEQTKFIREGNIFSQEAAFFNFLFPELKKSAVKGWCPKCLLADERMVVLEDVRLRGFTMREGKILSGEYVRSAARAQARMHASSLLAEARLGKTMREVCPEACVEHLFSENMFRRKRIDLSVDLAEKVAKKINRDHRRIKTALFRGFMRIYKDEQLEGGLDRVVCHGDTWTNNYMFDGSDPPNCVLIDFQIVRYAPRMLDVIQLLYLTTTRDIRTKEERKVIEAYYEEFCSSLESNPSVKKPSMSEILSEFEQFRLSVFNVSMLYYPIIALSQKELNILNGDPETLHAKVMFRLNNDYIMELLDRDEELSTRLSELVAELVDYCEKYEIPIEEENSSYL